MPTVANVNGGVAASAVTSDDRFLGIDGLVVKLFTPDAIKAYAVATVTSDIAAVQGVNAIQSTDIATNTASIATLNTTVGSLAVSTSNARTASYTLVLADGAIPFVTVVMNVATVNTLTIPPNASVAFPIGTIVVSEQWGIGTTTWTAGAGVTIRSRGSLVAMAGQWAAASARKIATNEWILSGDLA